MITFKYSKNLEAIRSRLRRLPELVNKSMDSSVKKDVISVIEEFRNGIKRNNFGLERLSDITKKIKREQGLSKPNTPLYGEEENEENSLINALAYRKIKNGYRLVRRWAKHHTANLELRTLLAIHENGAIINVTEKMKAFLHYLGIHLKKDTTIIRIPPRPVVDKAIIRALKKKKLNEPSLSIKKAINQLINQGKDSMFKKLTKTIEAKEYET